MKGDKIPLTRLWERTSANGRRYFSGYLGQSSLVMFLDEKAEGDNPVWQLFISEPQPKRGGK